MVGRVGDMMSKFVNGETPAQADPFNNPAGPKYDAGKLRWSLLPNKVVVQVVKVLEYGAVKYHEDSWKQVPEGRKRYYDAANRHIEAWWNGEKRDPETGLHHLAHACCNLFFLIWKDDNEHSS